MFNSSKKSTGTTVLKPSEAQLVRRQSRNNNKSNQQQLDQLHILGMAGSMRQGSYGTQILKMVLEEAKKYNTDTRILDLRQVNLPLYDPDNTTLLDKPSTSKEDNNNDNNNNLATISNVLKWADSIILSSPDYHGSMSGAMKNFLDYFWEEFAGKTFGYIVASHEKGLTVADQMRTAIRQCYGWSMPYNISINGEKDFDSKGILVNSALANRVKILARDLSVYGKLIRNQFLIDIANKDISETFAAHYRNYYN
ncbi:MAG TPA: NAD(P)H-dependent oxidoreductase [Nitrososphaeraceae archaeon]|nr:NAD(P)H-dependent oxidoreductase [Nitrososphaeraceae archaeon]